ncbi:MAG: putative Methyltransferase type 11 [Promethearchaeota archaeon]|nr:MAG: putative Methyltransferase type 11 [Candidatus Lokiarchaeota archaeon]
MTYSEESKLDQYQKDYYVGAGSNYAKLPGGYLFLRRAIFWMGKIKLIKKYKAQGKILDIGCSYGFMLYFMRNDFKIYGCDISKHAIRMCKRIFPDLPDNRFWVHDVTEELPFGEYFFDLISCIDVIEHIEDINVPLRNIHRCLARDGILFLHIPIKTQYKITEFLRFDNDQTHVSVLPAEKLISKLRKIGFKILERNYYWLGFIPIPNFINFGSDITLILKKA